jgi:cytochrome c1
MSGDRPLRPQTAFYLLLISLLLFVAACQEEATASDLPFMPGGDPEAGAELIEVYGCGACHTIPGIDNADALVGPPLTAWAERQTIAGAVPNTPEYLLLWLQNPQALEPGTIMPDVGLNEQGARHVGAYLYTLTR